MTRELPASFLESMKKLLGAEYDAWLGSFEESGKQGLRINRLKLDNKTWEAISPYNVEAIPWTANGYFYHNSDSPSKDVYYSAGLYYLQEPSAMTPAQLLPVKPGDRVLDLCAAPGGKSTELGARLQGEGLLISNDISSSRAKALLKNIELSGISNACVTSETPDRLADTFGPYFDAVLVDAPCSGEGMFRKDPGLIKEWQKHGPDYYAPVQKEILSQAVRMLKPGGYLLYSTCTFSPVEDEDVLHWLLEEEPQMQLIPLELFEGARPGINQEPVLRLFPHKIRGEGHFVALLRKQAASEPPIRSRSGETEFTSLLKQNTDFCEFEQYLNRSFEPARLFLKQDSLYYLPEGFSQNWKLRYLRTGLLLGEFKKGRFSPSQALAMALKKADFKTVISFGHEDDRVIRYLKGETIALQSEEQTIKGWCLVCLEDYPLGWAKGNGATLKNKYYPGWRRQGG